MCPPKNTYTDLNYDLIMTENMTLDEETRNELTSYAMELLYENMHDMIMTNLSKLEDNDRFYNWYQGYAEVQLPHYDDEGVNFEIGTCATSGNIKTKHFGIKFDVNKVETKLKYMIKIWIPDSVIDSENITFHLDANKISMKDLSKSMNEMGYLSGGLDNFYLNPDNEWDDEPIAADLKFVGKNYTPPSAGDSIWSDERQTLKRVKLERKVTMQDVRKQILDVNPGFSVSWIYSKNVLTDSTFSKKNKNKNFVRYEPGRFSLV